VGGIEHAHSHYDASTKTLIFFCTLGDKVCGHQGIVHGGLISALFDDIFGELFFSDADGQYAGFTAYLKIDYRNKMPSRKTIVFLVKISRQEGRKVYVKGEARDAHIDAADLNLENMDEESLFASYLSSKSLLYAEGEALFIIPRES
jgi:acyl-coenzyme A thioesterase PaaI-like protein